MYKDISHLTKRVPTDDLTQFIDTMKIEINGFGTWEETDVRVLQNFIIHDYELVYNFRGTSKVQKGDDEYLCPPGSVFLFEPFQSYTAQCCSDEKHKYFYIHFEIAEYQHREKLHNIVLGKNQKPLFIDPVFGDMGKILQTLSSPHEAEKPGSKSLLRLVLTRALIHMLRLRMASSEELAKPISSSKDIETVNLAITYANKNMDKPIKLSQLAKEIGVSDSTLYKAFINVFGHSPSKFFLHYKIKEAQRLINMGIFSINEIALKLGFSSAFHFSKAFKDVMGRSPSKF